MNTYICTVLAGAVEWRSRELSEQEAKQARRGIQLDLWLERHR